MFGEGEIDRPIDIFARQVQQSSPGRQHELRDATFKGEGCVVFDA